MKHHTVRATTVAASIVLAAIASQCVAQAATGLPICQVGMHVATVSPLNYGARILAMDTAKGVYQVQSDTDHLVDWVSAYKLRYSCIGVEAAAVTPAYFVGNWSLFVGPTAHHETIDSKAYLVVGPGAHAPPLQINADGSYVWIIDRQQTVRGKWRLLANHELRSGTKPPAILLIKAEAGRDWQVWNTGVNQGNKRDAIGVERMDLGQSYQGTRLK